MNSTTETAPDGTRWQIASAYRDLLPGLTGLPLGDWLRAVQAQTVKHGPHRTVYRFVISGRDFYLKHNRLMDARTYLRQLIRPAKARMEFDRALLVAERGIPTLTPVGHGERGHLLGPGESYLLTLGLTDTRPLDSFIEKTLPSFEQRRQVLLRRRLAAELGNMMARMHEAGVVHHDLHPGNLLIRLDPDDRVELFLIDLHMVRVGRALGRRARQDNLVMLNRWFILRADRTDRLRFWEAYCRARSEEQGAMMRASGLEDQRLELESATWQSNLMFWRNRDRRCLASNRYYQHVRSAGVTGYAVRDLEPASLAALIEDPDGPFRRPGVLLLKNSGSSTVAEFDAVVDGATRRVIFKRFLVTSRSDPWLALLRRPPALRSWVFGHGLRERCLPTPRPLLVLHRRHRGLYHEGYLLTEKVPGVELHRFLSEHDSLLTSRFDLVSRLIEKLARLIRELHHRCLSHRDLKAANILVSIRDAASPDVDFDIWLIDLVGVTRHRHLSRSRQVQNLARLNASFHRHSLVSRADKLRFLRIYLDWGLRGKLGWKDWWRQIEEATQAKILRNQRNGRPLA